MKKILSRISIIALVLVTVIGIAIPAFAAENETKVDYYGAEYTVIASSEYGHEARLYHDQFTGLDILAIPNPGNDQSYGYIYTPSTDPNWEYTVGYRTGHFGDTESTGVYGMTGYKTAYRDNVTWTLKDGVLFLDGVGGAGGADSDIDPTYQGNPFKGNRSVKTIIVGEYVEPTSDVFQYLPNLETVIFLGGHSEIDTKGSPNLKTVIIGGNLEDNAIEPGHTNNKGNAEFDVIVLANNLRNIGDYASTTYGYTTHLPKTATVYYSETTIQHAAAGDLGLNYDVGILYQNGVQQNTIIAAAYGEGDIANSVLRQMDKLVANGGFDNSWDELVAMYAYTVANADLPDWALDLLPDKVRNAPATNPFEQAPVDPPVTPPVQPAVQFTDVPADAYYADAVNWAVAQGITSGTSATTFSPDATCTNAQILTFLYRAAGSPKVYTYSDINGVADNAYYYDAVQWALEKGIIRLADVNTLDAPCTRANAVIFIWKANNKPLSAYDQKNWWKLESVTPFSDVPTDDLFLAQAINWAVEQGITSGTSATTFSPDATCTRGQIVTFLHRAFAK